MSIFISNVLLSQVRISMGIGRTLVKLRQKGAYYYLYFGWQWAPFQKFLYKRRRPSVFLFGGKRIPYLYANYNRTWMNERAIEIPVIRDFVEQEKGEILEVGNVLSHYFPVNHDIVDKYERAKNVINEDIETYASSHKYALIISISTLEHVGFDETIPDDDKIVRVFEHLKSMLTPTGKIVATLPIGYNPSISRLIKDKTLTFSDVYSFKRVTRGNLWRETSFDEACDTPYGQRYPGSGAFVIGIYDARAIGASIRSELNRRNC